MTRTHSQRQAFTLLNRQAEEQIARKAKADQRNAVAESEYRRGKREGRWLLVYAYAIGVCSGLIACVALRGGL